MFHIFYYKVLQKLVCNFIYVPEFERNLIDFSSENNISFAVTCFSTNTCFLFYLEQDVSVNYKWIFMYQCGKYAKILY